jgi:phosphoribosylamine-glycine ligase
MLAKDLAYKALEKINFDNIYYRKDIADKAFK